jgi:hypothetical protein
MGTALKLNEIYELKSQPKENKNLSPTQSTEIEKIKTLYSDANGLMATFNPINQYKIAEDKDRAYTGVSPSLVSIKNAYGAKTLNKVIIAQLENLNDFCGASVKMESNVIIELTYMIQSRYYYLKIAELLLFFFNFKMGKYCELYGSVDPLKITTSLNKFIQERNLELDRIEREQKQTEPLKTQGANIVRGIESVKELSQRAKTDYKAFRELYPRLPSDRLELVYWRAWRLSELRVGKYLCEFNIKNK